MVKAHYLDTSIYIYYFEDHPSLGGLAEWYFREAEKGNVKIIASPLVIEEIMAGVYALNQGKPHPLLPLLREHPHIEWKNFDLVIADLAARLRAKLRIRTPDAIHVATALFGNAHKFVTSDRKLARACHELPIDVVIL